MKKRGKTLYKYILLFFLLLGALLGFCVLLRNLLPHPFAESLKNEERISKILSQLKLSPYLSSSYNQIKERDGIRWIHFTKEFSLPKQMNILEYVKKIENASKRWANLRIERKKGCTYVHLFCGSYPTHTLLFRYSLPRIAIIIDDMGHSMTKEVKSLLLLPYPLTFSILPHLPYTKTIASLAHKRGYEVMVHLPMEPHEKKYAPGAGAVFTWMDEEQIKNIVLQNIKSVPYAKGANNHMGSKFTENEAAISAVLDILKKNGKFFIDSRTSSRSVAYKVAKKKRMSAGYVDLFLDNVQSKDAIEKNLHRLSHIAKKKGWAIGIAHVQNPHTLSALLSALPKIGQEAEIVPVSKLLTEFCQ